MSRAYGDSSHRSPFHNGSHRHLLSQGERAPAPGKVDALVVPTARRAASLRHVMWLAEKLAVPLVALCSRWAGAEAALKEAQGAGIELIAIDVPAAHEVAIPPLATSELLAGTVFERKADTSLKRNLGLLIARMAGWRKIVFLDDDVMVGDPDDLLRAARLLDAYEGVGLAIGGFPDNSVVCHAYREIGGEQDTFVGGGALAVDPVRTTSFFPNIYNEDWFYLLDDKRLRPVAVTGSAIQAPYDPFRDPRRARGEEFGDVLAEGLYSLLDDRGTVRQADRAFWTKFLGKRRLFIKEVLREVESASGLPGRGQMAESLRAALGRLELMTPEHCEAYLHAWLADRSRWRKYVRRLPARVELARAIEELGLVQHTIVARTRANAGVGGMAGGDVVNGLVADSRGHV